RELRQLREAHGLTAEAVAEQADLSQSSLSRVENAVVQIKVPIVKALLDVYNVSGEQRDALIALTREANRENWWHAYGDVLPDWFEPYVDLEGEAEMLSVYDTQFVNGLLQTEDYARALISAARPEDSREEIDRRVELRMQRQSRVLGGDLRLRLIVDECVLHRAYGGVDMMPAQIRRILEVADLRTVSLQVLPADSPTGAVGAFTILEFPIGDPTVVYVENDIGALYMEKPEHVRQYSRLCDRLRAAALSPEASVTHIAHLLEE
ncbi:MAG TPA: helix-turn-helix transcriptional regulator, partial [Mycobacteriales bacterium]